MIGTLKTEKLQPNYKMTTNNISHNIRFVKSLSLIVTKKYHFFYDIFSTHTTGSIGFAIGIFTGSMLLEKKVAVFQLKKWLLLGGLTAVFFLTVDQKDKV